MSGSGGSAYGVSGGRRTDCDIVEQVPLNSVQAAVLGKLSEGQKLDVVVVNAGRSLAAQVATDASIAGSLTPQSLVDLLACIERGHEYTAVVIRKKGAFVLVEIRPR